MLALAEDEQREEEQQPEGDDEPDGARGQAGQDGVRHSAGQARRTARTRRCQLGAAASEQRVQW